MQTVRKYAIGSMMVSWLVFSSVSGSIPVISVHGNAYNGSSITLACTIPGRTTTATWTNDNSFAGGSVSCSPSFCGGISSYTRYTFTTNNTGIYIEINPLMRSEDDGIWTCAEVNSSKPFPLYVNSQMNTSTSINVNTTDSNVGITCTTRCVYPHNTISAVVQYSTDGGTKYKDLGSAVSEYSNVTGCGLNEVHLTSTLSSSVCTSELKGQSVMFRCQYNNTELSQTQNGVASSSTQLTAGCQSTTVPSSTVDTSTPEPSPSFQPCLISNSLLLWQCILIWIVIGVAVIILLGCCVFCLCRKRQKSKKKQSIENNKMQNLKDKSRNNKEFDDKTENKDRTDIKSVDKSGYDNSGYDKSGYDKSGYDKSRFDNSGYDKSGCDMSRYDNSGYDMSGYDNSGYDKSGCDNYQFYRGNRM